MFLKDTTFRTVIEATPLVSIDLVIMDPSGKALVGRRLNRPAQGFWFVPGGRIRKDETIESAFARISEAELGFRVPFVDAEFMGVYEHLYDDCVFDDGITTHYVVLAYQVRLGDALLFKTDDQHDSFEWWDRAAILSSSTVHVNTKAYFK